jgi:hypothetical protein
VGSQWIATHFKESISSVGTGSWATLYLFNELMHQTKKAQQGYEERRSGLSYFDAVDHWQNGGGTDIRVPLSSLDLSGVTSADFPKGMNYPTVVQLSGRIGTDMSTQTVYGNVTLTLIAPGIVTAGYDRYNFDIQGELKSVGRDVATALGGVVNSAAATVRNLTLAPGRSFFIQLDGSAKIGR